MSSEVEFTSVVRQPAYAQVAEQIRQAILRGDLVPGQVLPTERELSVRLDVGRTTIREAIRSLQAQGLLEIGPGVAPSRTRVASSAESMLRDTFTNFARLRGVRLEDLFSIRAVLEGDAVRRASEQPSSPYIEEAAQALEEMRALPVGPEFDDADMRFHCCLVRASGSEAAHVLVLAINDAMVSQMAPAVLQGGSGGFRAVKLRQHRSLIDAIRAGDGDKAASIISRHLKAGFAALPAETLNEPKGDAR